jgi:rhodanese-related sulfurtransferase
MFGLFKKKEANYTNLTSQEFKGLMDSEKEIIILDVRTPSEAKNGKIKGAKVIDWMSSSFKSETEKLSKDKTLLVYCRSGNRSGSACNVLGSMGFKNVYNLKGGVMAWKFPLIK